MVDGEKIVFLGGIIEGRNKKFKAKGILLSSADILQRNILDGFIENGVSDLQVVNSAFVGTYPAHCDQCFIKKQFYLYKNRFPVYDASFFNIPIVNEISRGNRIYAQLREKVQKENVSIVVYSLLIRNLIAINRYARYNPNAKFTLIVTDIPEYMAMNIGGFISKTYHTFIKMWFKHMIDKANSNIAKCVYLTEYMSSVLFEDKPYIVIEGMINKAAISKECSDVRKKRILYTGGLEESLGVKDMIEAFELLDDDVLELDIAGDGSLRNYIEQKVQLNNHIKFLGKVPYKQAIELQRTSEVLISPTRNNGKHSLYAFPAKLIEYLLTGNKVISRKLPGIPKDYYSYLFMPDDDSVEGLKECIKIACETNRTENERKEQMIYIEKNKNNVYQTSRILDFIRD